MRREDYLSALENTVQNCDFISRASSAMDIKTYTDMLEQKIKDFEEKEHRISKSLDTVIDSLVSVDNKIATLEELTQRI